MWWVLVHVCVMCTRIPDSIYRTYSEYIIIWQLSIIIIWGMRQGRGGWKEVEITAKKSIKAVYVLSRRNFCV